MSRKLKKVPSTGKEAESQAEDAAPRKKSGDSPSVLARLNRAFGLPESSRDTASKQPPAAPPGITTPPTTSPQPSPGSPQPGTGASSRIVPPPIVDNRVAQTIDSAASKKYFTRRQSRRRRVRRTRRTLRYIDPWSVFKVSVFLYICLYVAVLLAGVALWSALQRSGLVGKLESFIAEVGSYSVWEIDGQVIFERARSIGGILAAAGVAINVVLAIVFNLISDLVGGIRVTILEIDDDR